MQRGQEVLEVQLYEPLEPGSVHFTLTEIKTQVPANQVRVAGGLELTKVPMRTSTSRGGRAQVQRFRLDDDSLRLIRAAMPTMNDEWDVEAIRQWRTYYRKDQWLIKWKGYGEDRNVYVGTLRASGR